VLAAAIAVFTAACSLLGFQYLALALLAGAAATWQKGRRWVCSGSHGTARFAAVSDLLRHGMLGESGLILGRVGSCTRPTRAEAVRAVLSPGVPSETAVMMFTAAFFTSRWMSRRLIRVRSGVHLNTVAPSGRGKNVCVLSPNLLSHSGSCVVFDPAGELFNGTAAHRARMFGHTIIRLDPYGVCGPGGDSYNVLGHLRAEDADLVEQCRDLGDQLIVRKGTEHEPHWNESACNMLGSFIFLIALCETNPDHRNLQCLRDILSSKQKFERACWVMTQHAEGSTMRRLGDMAGWLQDRELWSVMSNVQRHTTWMDTQLVADCMGRSTFNPNVLRTGKATVYLILPHNKLSILHGLIRLWIGSIMRLLTRPGADVSHSVLFLLDESSMLGHMRVLEDAVTQYRKFGIKLWFFWQSIDQMKECFGERANVILGNMDTQQYFGINDPESAEAISKRMGDATIVTMSRNKTVSHSQPTGHVGPQQQAGSLSNSTSITTNELGRRLLKPEEILTLPEGVSLVFHKNLHVIPAWQVYHYADREFKRGGTGRQPGLGLAAGVVAATVLMSSMLFAGFVLSLLRPVTAPPPSPGRSVNRPYGYPTISSQQAVRRRTRRPPTPFNQLIRIR
jgi:type IV secretion system protein VirD4